MQLNHYNSKFKPHSFPVVIISDGLSSPFNIGGLFRLGVAFGIERIIFLNTLNGLGKRFKKTSRSAEKYIPYCFEDSFEGVHKELKNKGYQFIILEISKENRKILVSHTEVFKNTKKTETKKSAISTKKVMKKLEPW